MIHAGLVAFPVSEAHIVWRHASPGVLNPRTVIDPKNHAVRGRFTECCLAGHPARARDQSSSGGDGNTSLFRASKVLMTWLYKVGFPLRPFYHALSGCLVSLRRAVPRPFGIHSGSFNPLNMDGMSYRKQALILHRCNLCL